jgi:hypothetical protein
VFPEIIKAMTREASLLTKLWSTNKTGPGLSAPKIMPAVELKSCHQDHRSKEANQLSPCHLLLAVNAELSIGKLDHGIDLLLGVHHQEVVKMRQTTLANTKVHVDGIGDITILLGEMAVD